MGELKQVIDTFTVNVNSASEKQTTENETANE